MEKLSDERIRELAEQAGFWSVSDGWWEQTIPMLRKFSELVKYEEAYGQHEAPDGEEQT